MSVRSIRVEEFDIYRAGYAGRTVTIYQAGTQEPAEVFSDVGLSVPTANPQYLTSYTDANGTTYGKFAAPVYVGTPYSLDIDISGQTGVVRMPLYDADAVDLSTGLVTSSRGSAAQTLANLAAGPIIEAREFGRLDGDAAENNAVLAAGLNATAAAGGGTLLLPTGSIEATSWTIPANVVLQGQGRGVTLLRSALAEKVCTFGGNAAGLRNLTLDGISANVGSVGLYAATKTDWLLDGVEITRFEKGLSAYGGQRLLLRQLYLTACATGGELRGDAGILRGVTWLGGFVGNNTNIGLQLYFQDNPVEDITIEGVEFLANLVQAFSAVGARRVKLRGGRMSGGVTHVAISDGLLDAYKASNTTQAIEFERVGFDAGEHTFTGASRGVVYDSCKFASGNLFTMNAPSNTILMRNCDEEAAVGRGGVFEALLKENPGPCGVCDFDTTSTTPTKIYEVALQPGEILMLRARVYGYLLNGVGAASFWLRATAWCSPATMTFDSANAVMVAGAIITGQISGATARLVAYPSGSVLAGTMSIIDINGIFAVGETCDTDSGVTFRTTGIPVTGTVSIDPSTAALQLETTSTFSGQTAWAASWGVTGGYAALYVNGAAGQAIRWRAEIDMLRHA